MIPRGSLVRRVLLISIVVFALPLLVFFGMVFQLNYRRALDDAVLRLDDLQGMRVQMMTDETDGILLGLRIMDDLLDLGNSNIPPSSEELTVVLGKLANLTSLPVALLYISAEGETRGQCIASSKKYLVGTNYGSYPFFKTTVEAGQGAWLHMEESNKKVFYDVAQAVYAKDDHRLIGVFMATFPADYLVKRLTMAEQEGFRIDFSLLRDDKTIIATSLPHLMLHRFQRTGPDGDLLLANKTSGDERTFHIVDMLEHAFVVAVDGKEYLAIQSPVPHTNFTLLLAADKSDVFRDVYSSFYSHLLLALGIFFIGSLTTLWVTNRMAKPFNTLVETMKKVSQGGLGTRYQSDRYGFEINALGDIFNTTMDSLLAQTEKAEQERVQKETYEQELQIGHDIQQSILPQTMPDFAGVEIATRYIPAKQVGGDFYDLFVQQDGENKKLVCAVGDTSGKGISACLYSLGIRSILRSYGHEPLTPANIAIQSNNLFCSDTGASGMFVTTFFGIFDPVDKMFNYFSAGHNPAYLRRTDGTIETLTTSGIAMGVIEISEQEQRSVPVRSGDILFIYSDGVTETHNINRELYGTERFEEYIHKASGNTEAIAEGLITELKEFGGDYPQHDDITLMVLKIL